MLEVVRLRPSQEWQEFIAPFIDHVDEEWLDNEAGLGKIRNYRIPCHGILLLWGKRTAWRAHMKKYQASVPIEQMAADFLHNGK
jgi:hypothetical protein